MFSKNKLTSKNKNLSNSEVSGEVAKAETTLRSSGESKTLHSAPKSKPAVSSLSTDLVIKGNIQSTGDIQIEGTVEGDIRAHLLTVGIGATIKGEIIADDVVINGKIIGRVRGLKVRLTSSAKVDGDIIHKTIAIESGAHFEGSVQRQDDPLSSSKPNIEFKKTD